MTGERAILLDALGRIPAHRVGRSGLTTMHLLDVSLRHGAPERSPNEYFDL